MTTIRHFIPLIGPYLLAAKKLNIQDESEIYSFIAFKNNEQHILNNFKDKNIIYIDEKFPDILSEVNPSTNIKLFKEYVNKENIKPTNIITAVPPCAGLSLLNASNLKDSDKSRGSDAIQNNWIYSALKFYLTTDSDVLVLENAPGLVGDKGIPIIRNIKKIIDDNKYERKIQLVKTTTLNHGLPQHRQRSFLIIHKNSEFIKLKNKLHESIKVEEFLSGFQSIENDECNIPMHGENNAYSNEWLRFIKDEQHIIKQIEEIVKEKDDVSFYIWPYLIEKIIPNNKTLLNNYPLLTKDYEFKLKKVEKGLGYWDASPIYIKGKTNAIISKNAFRILNPLNRNSYLTIRQMMYLMGMPQDFMLKDPLRNFNHICQNVPVNTAADSLLWAIECLDNKSDKIYGNYEFIFQNNMKMDLENEIFYHDNKDFKKIKNYVKENKLF